MSLVELGQDKKHGPIYKVRHFSPERIGIQFRTLNENWHHLYVNDLYRSKLNQVTGQRIGPPERISKTIISFSFIISVF